ncbi:UNVERIFIED_CONTAM: hypothetical protein GTU68_060493 [Idotea baltica]|nr:hypothetical protein [Idotea baltica]
MGKTGCGKSTIIEAICGLREVHNGQILLNGDDITSLLPGQRSIGYVPQDGALFTHMTVEKNIGFALKLRKWEKSKIENRVIELSNALGITHLLQRKAVGLSGGEVQRVALARALSFKPHILCLDEPLSALDDDTKEEMFELLEKLIQELNVTILHVSHSKMEAKRLASKVLLMENGKITELETGII